MKHVWMLNHYAQAPTGAGGTRHYSLAKHLTSYGWDATIIASSFEQKTGRQLLDVGEYSRLENIGGVRFLRIRTSGYSGNGIDRIHNMVQYTIRVLQSFTLNEVPRPDVIIGSSVHPFAAWAAMRLAKRYGVPFIFEVRDLWPQTLIDMRRIGRNSVPAVLLRALEKHLYRKATRIISLLPFAHQYISRFGIDRKKIAWISNGVDLSDYCPPRAPVERSTVTLMYFGAHGGANGLDNVLHAMKLVNSSNPSVNVLLRLIGDGPQKPNLKALAAELQLENVHFDDPVARKDIPEIAETADVFVLAVRNLPELYRYGISMNKLFDYMAAGRPIVISVSASNNPVKDAGCGITVEPDNPQALANAIVQITGMTSTERHQMGMRGRRHAEAHYDYRVLAEKLADVLDSCLA